MCVCVVVPHEQSDDVGDWLGNELTMPVVEDQDEMSALELGVEEPTQKSEQTSWEEDIDWAYHNRGKVLLRASAPSNSAWQMLQWATEDYKAFLIAYAKVQQEKEKREEGERVYKDDKRRQMIVLANLLDEWEQNDIEQVSEALLRNPTKTLEVVDKYERSPDVFRNGYTAIKRRTGATQI